MLTRAVSPVASVAPQGLALTERGTRLNEYLIGPAPTSPSGDEPDPLSRVRPGETVYVILLGPWTVVVTHAPHSKNKSQVCRGNGCKLCAGRVPKRKKYYASCARYFKEGSATPGWVRVVQEVTEGARSVTWRPELVGKSIKLWRDKNSVKSKVFWSLASEQPPADFELPFSAGAVKPTLQFIYDLPERLEEPTFPKVTVTDDGEIVAAESESGSENLTSTRQPALPQNGHSSHERVRGLTRSLADAFAEGDVKEKVGDARSGSHRNGKAVR